MSYPITGTGMVTSVGSGTSPNFEAMCAGTSGSARLRGFDRARFGAKHAYEIDDRIPGEPDEKGRASRWLQAALDEALGAAGRIPSEARISILVGTGLRELRSLELWWCDDVRFGVEELHFGTALRRSTGLDAPVTTLSNACAASNFALGMGVDLLATDEADVVIVAGCDSITESMFGLLDRVNPLHPERVQPFDRNRRGVLMGEGAAAVVLERPEHAAARGAEVRAWLRGVGMGCDAHHETAPDHAGIVFAMQDAYRRADVGPERIDLLMVHGTGTLLNDRTEASALHEVFGERVGSVAVSGLKSMTGHTSGASGLVGVITAIESLRHGRIPPTLGLEDPMAEATGLDLVRGAARERSARFAQVNAFGFGGVNAVVILERCDP